MAIIIDAAVGAGISELLRVVIFVAKKTLNFKSNLKSLEKTLESVKPIFENIENLNGGLNRPKEETDHFIEQLNRGIYLVYKCTTIPCWSKFKLYRYSIKLENLDKSIIKFFTIEVQGFIAVNSLRNGVGIKEMNDKFDIVLKSLNTKFKHRNAEVYGPLSVRSSWQSFPGPPDGIVGFDTIINQTYPVCPTTSLEDMICKDVTSHPRSKKGVIRFDPKVQSVSVGFACRKSVPVLPNSIVRFDKPLQDLREMLMQDNEPVTVISGPGRCGKTTLATMLCHDPEIQREFGKNILFVTVSELANITLIVVKILKYQMPDSQLPDIQNDVDAIKLLERFLKLLGPSPILLVLDDVWSNLEYLVENFIFTLPNYKVLVTFRFISPRFSHVCNLKDLDDQHSMTIFRLSALPKDESSRIPDNLVEKAHFWRPEVVWRREEKKWSNGDSIFDTNRVLLDRLSTSLAFEEMKDSLVKDCFTELRTYPEDQRTLATTLMDMAEEQYSLDHKDMDTYNTLVEPSFGNLLDLVCKRMVEIQGKSESKNAGKGTKADAKKPKTIQRNRPKIKISSRASQTRRSLPGGVVIREPSAQVIPQASQCETTSAKGEKGKEKVVYMPEKKALRPEDESEKLLQELRGPLFNRAVFVPTTSHVQRPPTNETSTFNHWNSHGRVSSQSNAAREAKTASKVKTTRDEE